jgi:non-heme chloroperoxidase
MSDIKVNKSLLGLNNVKLHVEDSGSGRPVILIHGWPLSGASFKHQVPALLSAGYRVITYDRRGFGQSDKPLMGYDYDTLAQDLHGLIEALNLTDITLLGFSMGGGEVARYISKYGEERIHSVVFASAVPPMMMKTDDNPEGPLESSVASKMTLDLTMHPDGFFEDFTKQFFSANGDGHILVSEAERQEAIALCKQAGKLAALEAMQSFATTDFRDDLTKVTVPALVLHGDADGTVPYLGSGARTHKSIAHSQLHVIAGGPHGINASHIDEFNKVLLDFLGGASFKLNLTSDTAYSHSIVPGGLDVTS